MYGIFCYLEESLILPFYNVRVYIPEVSKEEVNNLVKTTKITLSLLSKVKKAGVKILYQEIGKFEVEKYGIESAYYRSTKYLATLGKAIVSNNNLLFDFSSNVDYVKNYNKVLELEVGYIVSKFMRENRLAWYSKHYPYLNIKKHKGKLNKDHLNTLLGLSSLPYFYNESLIVNYTLANNLHSK
jgi:hypothetical protein